MPTVITVQAFVYDCDAQVTVEHDDPVMAAEQMTAALSQLRVDPK